MTILIAALAAAVLSAVGLAPAGTVPAELDVYREALIFALSLVVAWQGLKLTGRGKKEVQAPAAPQAVQAPAEPVAAPQPVQAPVVPAPKPAPAPVTPRQEPIQTGEALVLLSLLQEKGRFLDYVMEDITAFKDAQVAAASRVVHQGCAAVIREYLAISPAHPGKEGERITVDPAADPNNYRLLGKVPQVPPYSGVVMHRGWKTTKLALPRHTRPIDPAGENFIAPIEVEIK